MINEINVEIVNYIFINVYRLIMFVLVEEERSIGVQNVEIIRFGFIFCKGNVIWEVYGDLDCFDNLR